MKRISLTMLVALVSMLVAWSTTNAQFAYDVGNSEIVIGNSSGKECFWMQVFIEGLVFDAELDMISSGSCLYSTSIGYWDNGTEVGIDVSWDSNVGVNGDVDIDGGELCCGLYKLYIHETQDDHFSLTIDLTDANWGVDGAIVDPYYLYIEYNGYMNDADIYVYRSDAGVWGSAGSYESGSTVTYWGLIDAAFPAIGYSRERTTAGGYRFNTSLDELPPDPSTTCAPDVILDVNLEVNNDVTVASNSSLTINPFDEGSAAASGTTLKFEQDAGITVEGELVTGALDLPYEEKVIFTSLEASPSSGDWDGIYGSTADYIDLNNAKVEWAESGVTTNNCYEVVIRNTAVMNSDQEGINLINSDADINSVRAVYNGNSNLRVYDGSIAFVESSQFSYSETSNGITVDDQSYLRILRSLIEENDGHGIVSTTYGRTIVDTCVIRNNGTVAGCDTCASDAYGIYSFYNNWLVSVRHSSVSGQLAGLSAYSGTIVGHYTPSFISSASWDNADSVALLYI